MLENTHVVVQGIGEIKPFVLSGHIGTDDHKEPISVWKSDIVRSMMDIVGDLNLRSQESGLIMMVFDMFYDQMPKHEEEPKIEDADLKSIQEWGMEQMLEDCLIVALHKSDMSAFEKESRYGKVLENFRHQKLRAGVMLRDIREDNTYGVDALPYHIAKDDPDSYTGEVYEEVDNSEYRLEILEQFAERDDLVVVAKEASLRVRLIEEYQDEFGNSTLDQILRANGFGYDDENYDDDHQEYDFRETAHINTHAIQQATQDYQKSPEYANLAAEMRDTIDSMRNYAHKRKVYWQHKQVEFFEMLRELYRRAKYTNAKGHKIAKVMIDEYQNEMFTDWVDTYSHEKNLIQVAIRTGRSMTWRAAKEGVTKPTGWYTISCNPSRWLDKVQQDVEYSDETLEFAEKLNDAVAHYPIQDIAHLFLSVNSRMMLSDNYAVNIKIGVKNTQRTILMPKADFTLGSEEIISQEYDEEGTLFHWLEVWGDEIIAERSSGYNSGYKVRNQWIETITEQYKSSMPKPDQPLITNKEACILIGKLKLHYRRMKNAGLDSVEIDGIAVSLTRGYYNDLRLIQKWAAAASVQQTSVFFAGTMAAFHDGKPDLVTEGWDGWRSYKSPTGSRAYKAAFENAIDNGLPTSEARKRANEQFRIQGVKSGELRPYIVGVAQIPSVKGKVIVKRWSGKSEIIDAKLAVWRAKNQGLRINPSTPLNVKRQLFRVFSPLVKDLSIFAE